MVSYSLIDTSNYKLVNDSENNIYIKTYQHLIFQPNETKNISIPYIFYINNSNFLYFLMNNNLESIFDIVNSIYSTKMEVKNINLLIYNKTNKTIIINENEKFIKICENNIFDLNNIKKKIERIKNKNINNIIFENIIELQNNVLTYKNYE
jgi:hypothetical protein